MTTTEKTEVQQIHEDWLANLRDPETKQGVGALRAPDGGFCCLGVLGKTLNDQHPDWLEANGFAVEIAPDDSYGPGMVITDLNTRYRTGDITSAAVSSDAALPVRLALSLGLPVHDKEELRTTTTIPFDHDTTLAGINDSGDSPFTEIADLIEKEILA